MAVTSPLASESAKLPPGLNRDQLLELYYYMRLTRTLEERLVNLYRQTKVVGGLFRSLGQEADAVGSAYALDRSKSGSSISTARPKSSAGSFAHSVRKPMR